MSLVAGVRKACLFVLFFGVFAPRALAAFGVCQAGWEWAYNSKQQNPCEIGGGLEAPCEGFSVYELGPLEPGTNYVTPQRNSTTSQMCQCNTVMFSLYMACTACQNVTTQTWTFWSQFCDQVYVTQYPESIPVNTSVPHWAFLDYTVGDKFDPVLAMAAGGQPETSAPVPSTVSLSGGSGSASSISGSPTSTPTRFNQVNKPSPRTGAIAGGVIGGLAFLAAVGVGVWIFLRRRATAGRRDGMFGGIDGDYLDYPRHPAGSSVSEHGRHPSQMRLYDPSDPSTFPSHGDYQSSGAYTTPSNRGYYSGAAEL